MSSGLRTGVCVHQTVLPDWPADSGSRVCGRGGAATHPATWFRAPAASRSMLQEYFASQSVRTRQVASDRASALQRVAGEADQRFHVVEVALQRLPPLDGQAIYRVGSSILEGFPAL